MVEQFANNASSTLASGIDSSTTSVTLVDASRFSSTGTYRIVVESEIMQVTSRSSNTLTVVRGSEGSIAIAHASGTTATQILTASAVSQLKSDVKNSVTLVDAFSNRPAAGSSGRMFYPTDGGFSSVDDGTKWRPLVKSVLCTEPPDPTTLSTQVNYSTTTLTKSNGALKINAPTAAATQLRAALTTIPTPSACEIQVLPMNLNSQINTGGTGVPCVGICMRESSTGKIASILYGFNMPFGTLASIVTVGTWSSATTRTANSDFENTVTPIFLRMRIAGGTLFREISHDLNTWDTVSSNTVTTFFTTAPDQYGVCVQVENTMIAYIPHLILA